MTSTNYFWHWIYSLLTSFLRVAHSTPYARPWIYQPKRKLIDPKASHWIAEITERGILVKLTEVTKELNADCARTTRRWNLATARAPRWPTSSPACRTPTIGSPLVPSLHAPVDLGAGRHHGTHTRRLGGRAPPHGLRKRRSPPPPRGGICSGRVTPDFRRKPSA
jgi:hypothetical protein